MSELKRYDSDYDVDSVGRVFGIMRESRSGPWVEHEVYQDAAATIQRLEAELALKNEALNAIVDACKQSRTATRRLRFIQQRAQWALDCKKFLRSAFSIPKRAEQTNESLFIENRKLREELTPLRALFPSGVLHEQAVAVLVDAKRYAFIKSGDYNMRLWDQLGEVSGDSWDDLIDDGILTGGEPLQSGAN